MLVVPLSGDKIETRGGVVHTVLSYTNYKDRPAVYVEGEDPLSARAETVAFDDIASVNGSAVKLTPGKVLDAVGRVKRKLQLPQVDDKVSVDGKGVIKLEALKLAERGKLSNGMLVVGTHIDTKEKITARLAEVTAVTRADGGTDFNRRALSTLYADYLGSPT